MTEEWEFRLVKTSAPVVGPEGERDWSRLIRALEEGLNVQALEGEEGFIATITIDGEEVVIYLLAGDEEGDE